MVYAMFSIGILGFIVWSILMGLFLSNFEVINFVISQKIFIENSTILHNLFYNSKNLFFLIEQLAETLNSVLSYIFSEITSKDLFNYLKLNFYFTLIPLKLFSNISISPLTLFNADLSYYLKKNMYLSIGVLNFESVSSINKSTILNLDSLCNSFGITELSFIACIKIILLILFVILNICLVYSEYMDNKTKNTSSNYIRCGIGDDIKKIGNMLVVTASAYASYITVRDD